MSVNLAMAKRNRSRKSATIASALARAIKVLFQTKRRNGL